MSTLINPFDTFCVRGNTMRDERSFASGPLSGDDSSTSPRPAFVPPHCVKSRLLFWSLALGSLLVRLTRAAAPLPPLAIRQSCGSRAATSRLAPRFDRRVSQRLPSAAHHTETKTFGLVASARSASCGTREQPTARDHRRGVRPLQRHRDLRAPVRRRARCRRTRALALD